MKETEKHNERIAKMTFASVYPHYVTKVQKKGRTVEELHQIIEWLTGFDEKKLQKLIDEKITFETFFDRATLNPNTQLITGVICGYRIEEIENPLTKKVRYLDKLIDELAKGKIMEKILRKMNEIETYIQQFPDNVQEILRNIRKSIKDNAPEAEELFAYGMPAYKTNKKPLVYFAAFKNHIGFYATPSGHNQFQNELSKYKQGKGSVQFPLDQPIPYKLIERIVKFRVTENDEKTKKPTKKTTNR